MKPTKFPDYGMGDLEYGMYGDGYDEYDEDDFFYHMYFDEVSTTPIPPEFYDLLESVSNGANSGLNYPDYFDYFDKRLRNVTTEEAEADTTTVVSARQSKNTRYLNFKQQPSRRRNSKLLRMQRRSSDETSPATVSRDHNSDSVKVRSKRSPHKRKVNSSETKNKTKKSGFRKRKQIDPGIVGILDMRRPLFFRQSPFVSIALAKFVVLSTGVTTGRSAVLCLDLSLASAFDPSHYTINMRPRH